MEEFHPNFSWAYGLESSDGWTHFNTKNYQFFWDYGVNKKKYISGYNKYAGTLYVEFKDMIKSIKENNNVIIDQYLDLNLLRLINNNYILSYTPVFGDDIRLISKPNKIPYENLYKNKKNFNSYIEDIESRKKFLKKQPNIYIYEINDVSKRVFFPSKVLMLDGQISPPANYSYMSKNYEKNISYSLEKNLKPGKGNILEVKKIKNGYKIRVDTSSEGVLSLNSFFLPFWKVYVNDIEQSIINLADIHMGVELEKGLSEVKFLYDRIMFNNLFLEYIM